MRHKYTVTEKNCGWPAVYKQIAERYGEAEANELISKAEALYELHSKEYGECKGTKKLHITSAVAFGAIYLPLKDKIGSERAVQMMTEAAKPASVAKHNKIENLPPRLFMKVAQLITSKMFSESAGFQRRWLKNTADEKSYDLLTCPYVDTLKRMGCPEVCPAICIQDDFSFSNLKNGVIFERKKTLGRGDDCCDFCFRIPDKKSEQK